MEWSENITELAVCLAASNQVLQNPTFDRRNDHFGNQYATLAQVRDAIIPTLSYNGISVLQGISQEGPGMVSCETMLLHTSGQWIKSKTLIPCQKDNPQGFGSAATYARRYALMSMLSVVGDVDDDGNKSSLTGSPVDLAAVQRPLMQATTLDELVNAWRELQPWLRDHPEHRESLSGIKDRLKSNFQSTSSPEVF